MRATAKAALFLFSAAVLPGGVTAARGQSALDGFDLIVGSLPAVQLPLFLNHAEPTSGELPPVT